MDTSISVYSKFPLLAVLTNPPTSKVMLSPVASVKVPPVGKSNDKGWVAVLTVPVSPSEITPPLPKVNVSGSTAVSVPPLGKVIVMSHDVVQTSPANTVMGVDSAVMNIKRSAVIFFMVFVLGDILKTSMYGTGTEK